MSHPSSKFTARHSFLVLGASTLLIMMGSSAASAGGTITTAQATTAMKAAQEGAILVIYPPLPGWTQIGTAVSYSTGTGLSMTGTLTTTSPATATCVMTITLINYADAATGCTVNGTQNWSIAITTSTGAYSGTVTADMTLSGGPVTTQTWNVSVHGTASQSSLTFAAGTVTCNGTSFDATTL